MPNLLPFRDYSEHEVLNFYSCVTNATKGTLVLPQTSWKSVGSTDNNTAGPLNLGSSTPGAEYDNTVTQNFELIGQVTPVDSNSNVNVVGVLLKDVREFDENGEKLVFNTRKAAEMDVVIPNIQAVPILTRGMILVNDIDGTPAFGDFAYVGTYGSISTSGTIKVGKFLSRKDNTGYALVKIDIL